VVGDGWDTIYGVSIGSGSDPVLAVNPYGNAMAAFRSGMDGQAIRFASGQ